jgi:transposase-like protein
MMDFKSFNSAEATIAGIELYRMLKKSQQFNAVNSPIFETILCISGSVCL